MHIHGRNTLKLDKLVNRLTAVSRDESTEGWLWLNSSIEFDSGEHAIV